MRPLAIVVAFVLLVPGLVFIGGETASGISYWDGNDIDNEIIWWNASEGPWIVNNSFQINNTGELRIGDGAEIILNTAVNITVYGELVATNANFKKNDSGGFWGGIIYHSGSNGDITGCNFTNGTNVLKIMSDTVYVRDTIIDSSDVDGGVTGEHIVRVISADPLFDNVTVHHFQDDYSPLASISLEDTPYNLLLSDCKFYNMAGGTTISATLYAEGTIRDCEFTYGAAYTSVYLDDDAHIDVINSTNSGGWDNQIEIADDDSTLDIYWDAAIQTNDHGVGTLSGVQIDIENGTGIPQAPLFTNDSGRKETTLLEIHVYNEGSPSFDTAYAHHTPYNISATKPGYYDNHSYGVPLGTYSYLEFNLTAIDVDLIPILSTVELDITDAPIHLWGEDAELTLNISNTGLHNASTVTILFKDNHTTNGTFTWKEEDNAGDMIPNLEGNSNDTATGILSYLAPGWHNISIYVDHDNWIGETNNSNNNITNVSYFRVNVPPSMNYTLPSGKMNGTHNITGWAWDNRTDMDNMTDMVVEYMIEGYMGDAFIPITNISNITYTGDNQKLEWNFTFDTDLLDDYEHNITFRVSDGNHNYTNTTTFETDNDKPPVITNVSYFPSNGTITSTFTITLNYTDDNNSAPANITLNITSGPQGYNATNQTFVMELENATKTYNYTIGANYTVDITLPAKGNYTYHIFADDGTETTIENNSGLNYTLTVHNSPPAIPTNMVSDDYIGWGDTVTFSAWYMDSDNEGPAGGDYANITIYNGTYNQTHKMNYTGSDNVTGAYCTMDWVSVGYGVFSYYFNLSDGTNYTLTEIMTLNVSTPPALSNKSHEHNGAGSNANSEDLNYFNVTYSDIDGDAPTTALIIITNTLGSEVLNETMYNITSDYLNGVVFNYTYRLDKGDYNYSFLFNDGFTDTIHGPFPFTADNAIPTFSFVAVAALGDAKFLVNWTDHDIDDNATITLYYDVESTGANKTAITTAMEGDVLDSYLWNASALDQGKYYLFATIDDGTENFTYNLTDIDSTSIFVNHNPIVQNVTPTSSTMVNKEFEISWDTFDTRDNDTLTISLYYDTTPQPGNLIVTDPTNSGTYTWNTTSIPDGDYYIVVVASDDNDTVTAYSPATVQVAHPNPTFSLATDITGGEAYTGDTFNVTGTVTFAYPSYAKNLTLDIVETNESNELEPDPNGDFNISIQAPDTPGNYTLMVWVEIDGDTFNETLDLTVADPPRPDLHFVRSMIINPADPLEGGEVSVQVLVKNIGTKSGGASISLYIDTHDLGTHVDEEIIFLEVQQQSLIELEWTSTGEGSHDVFVIIDALGNLDEEDETNNNETKPNGVVVRVLPDFVVEDDDIVIANPTPTEGENISFTISVHNEGTLTGDCEVLVYLDGSKASPLYSGTITVEKGEQDEVTVYWPSAERGGQIIRVELDPDNDFDELDEGNNNAILTLDVEPLPEETDTSIAIWVIALIAMVGVAALVFIIWQKK